MPPWLAPYVMCFVPLFVAIDPVGLAPFYVSFVEGRPAALRRKILAYALLTASIVGLVFLFLGTWVLRLVGVSVADFKIAGGVLLLAIAVVDIVMADKGSRRTGNGQGEGEGETVGAVPIGMPLVMGPATVTTLLALHGRYPLVPVLAMFVVNLALVGLAFWQSERVVKVLGKAGARAVGKVMSLMLAAIAIKLIRVGVQETFAAAGS